MCIILLQLFTFLGVYKTIPKSKAFARKCNITKKGANRGYVCGNLFSSTIQGANEICIEDGWSSYDEASHHYYEIYYFSTFIPNDNGIWAYNKNGKKRLLNKEDRLERGYKITKL